MMMDLWFVPDDERDTFREGLVEFLAEMDTAMYEASESQEKTLDQVA